MGSSHPQTLSFVQRDVNKVANSLASLASLFEDRVWIEEVSPQILSLVNDDLGPLAIFS